MLIKLAWRNLWRNKLRTTIMLSAMVFGLLGVILMMGFMNAIGHSLISNVIAYQTSHMQIHNQRYISNPDIKATLVDESAITQRLDNNPLIDAYSTRLLINGMVASAKNSRGVMINGINPIDEANVTLMSDTIRQGEWLDNQGRNPILVSEKTANRLALRLGSKVVLTFTDFTGEVTGVAFKVKGIFRSPSSTFDEANVYVRQTDLARHSKVNANHEISVKLTHIDRLDDVYQQLRPLISAPNKLQTWSQIQPLLAAMVASLSTSNFIVLGIFVLAMGFGIINIMLMSVFERTQEFGVLMAIGMDKANIFKLIVIESGLLGLVGGLLGCTVSLLLMIILQRTGLPLGALAEGLGAMGIDTVLYPWVDANSYLITVAMVLCSSLAAALYPARQILKKPPVEAMSEKH
ncbi:ABC transporter permease [Aliivibrio kagoshimensis]|uniref:ABC transporter permease n=1 Tax=Aliivibrio kagoshimensis TaxID=2910230 RepID=UPI003D0B5670